jgi:hypothetical protein
MCVPGKLFMSSLIFAGNAVAYPSSAPPLLVRLLALLTNITSGWIGLPGTNNLAYYENS